MTAMLSDRALSAGAGLNGYSSRSEIQQQHLRELRNRIALLPKKDQILVELSFTGDRSIREVAQLIGGNPGFLSRRLKAVWTRLHSPIVDYLLDPTCAIAPELRQIGIERHLLGISAVAIAEKHLMRPAAVRQMLVQVKGHAQGAGVKC